MYKNELIHHGIKGQRWGVRRTPAQLGYKTKPKKRIMSEDAITANKLKKKKVSEMSNAELRKLNERQQLERSHSQLNKSAIAKGIAFATAATAFLNTAVNLYNNSSKVVEIGKKVSSKIQ